MNRAQRGVIIGGILVAVAMGLFAPRVSIEQRRQYERDRQKTSYVLGGIHVGHMPIWWSGFIRPNHPSFPPTIPTEINTALLLTQWLGVFVATGALVYALKDG